MTSGDVMASGVLEQGLRGYLGRSGWDRGSTDSFRTAPRALGQCRASRSALVGSSGVGTRGRAARHAGRRVEREILLLVPAEPMSKPGDLVGGV
eukprot:1744292-Rhodomonas_salina.1